MNEYTDEYGREGKHQQQLRRQMQLDAPSDSELSDKEIRWIKTKYKDEEAFGILYYRIKKFFAPILWIIGSIVLVVGSYFQLKGWFGPKGGP